MTRQENPFKNMPALPEDLEEYANTLFDKYGYYKHTRRNKETELTCSECGETTVLVTSKEAEKLVGIPEGMAVDDRQGLIYANGTGTCPHCGAKVIYKAKGRSKETFAQWNAIYVFQAERDGKTLWARIFDAQKEYSRNTAAYLWIREKARVKLQRDRKPVKYAIRYHTGWDTEGNKTERFGDLTDGELYPGSWEEIKKSFLKYTDIKGWDSTLSLYRLARNFTYKKIDERAAKTLRIASQFAYHPMLEFLEKQGYEGIVEMQIKELGIVGRRGKKPWDRLGVTREHMNLLKDEPQWIGALKQERERKERWKGEDLEYMVSAGASGRERRYRLKDEYGISYTKQRNYTSRQEENEGTWLDYLDMKKAAGYELDSIAMYPKDLKEAHDRMVNEQNAKKDEARKKEKEGQFGAIRKNFRELYKKFGYAKRGMSIRPAMSASEIIEEGRQLHHCVGASDRYMKAHAEGESYILFLRMETFKPYATVEINAKTGEVMQWYEAYDRKPDKDTIEPWLKEYTERLKRKGA